MAKKYFYEMMNLHVALFFLVGISPVPLAAQELRADSSEVEVRALDAKSLAKYHEDSDFIYDREPPTTLTWWEGIKHWIRQRLGELFATPASVAFWNVFPYLFVIVVVAFVLAHLLKAEFRSVFYKTGASPAQAAYEEIANFHAANFVTLAAEAVTAREYRLAVRYLFLNSLEQLADRQYIAWRAEKTNHDYLKEVQASPLHRAFQTLVLWFDYVWYGEARINETTFVEVRLAFEAFDGEVAKSPR